MKQKMSISIDSEKICLVESLVKEGVFRNKSHAIESALDKMLVEKR